MLRNANFGAQRICVISQGSQRWGRRLSPTQQLRTLTSQVQNNAWLRFCYSEALCDLSGANPTLNLQQFGRQPETGLANRFHLAVSHPLLQHMSKVAGVSALVERSALLSHYQVGGADRIWGS